MSLAWDSIKKSNLQKIIEAAIKLGATDVHLVANRPPIFRINGELINTNISTLEPTFLKTMIFSLLTDEQKFHFHEELELDFSFDVLDGHHLRANIHIDKGNIAATIRIIPLLLKTPEEMGIPSIIENFSKRHKGLVLITGPAGSGKTTTLTHIINHMNNTRRCKIICIEDPIEYVHQSNKSLIVQREVGPHTKSFAKGLKYALRQDPDVVVIGEMRDLESISIALTTAETGHLVLTTLHSSTAIDSLNRIIDVFPGYQQNQIRLQLAETLVGVISQNLLPQKNAATRILATEVMVANLSIRNIISRGAIKEIRAAMEDGKETGMYTFEQCLSNLYKKDLITEDVAISHANHPNLLRLF